MGLLREQAHALRESVAAAARSNRAASAFAAAQLGERLLDQARALAVLDGQGRLGPSRARGRHAKGNPLFRVAVFAADGSREERVRGRRPRRSPGARAARGMAREAAAGRRAGGGRGWGGGRGPGGGGGRLRQILEEGKRRGRDRRPRVALGRRARRGRGEARAGRRHRGDRGRHGDRRRREAGLARVAAARRSPPGARRSRTRSSSTRTGGSPSATSRRTPRPPPGERSLSVKGRPILEFASDVPLADGEPARLRLGMRLDNVRRVERRMLHPARGHRGRGGRPGGARLRPRRPAPPLRRPQREARPGRGGAAPSRPPRRDGRARLHRGPRGAQPPERGRHDGPAPEARVPGRRPRRPPSGPSSRSCSR